MSKRAKIDLSSLTELAGIGPKIAMKILEDLGSGHLGTALASIKTNPYNLMEIDGIGFKKADRVAQENYNLDKEDPRRHEAGNRHILQTYGVIDGQELGRQRAKLGLTNTEHAEAGIILEDGLYWLKEELEAELGLERWIRNADKELKLAKLDKQQKAICERLKLDDQQTYAVRVALGNKITCLTGGAGTGKTHVIAAIAMCGAVKNEASVGMAFAGKAADRMREAFEKYGIMAEASTIHRALGWDGKRWQDAIRYEHQIILDECSMIPNTLLWQVVNHASAQSRILLVGDPNQLPPIGYGEPFRSAIESGVARVHLAKNYRQKDQQGILKVAEGILERVRPEPDKCVDFKLGLDESLIKVEFESLVRESVGTPLDGWQAITWQNENVEKFNLIAQDVINPKGEPLFEYPLWKLSSPKSKRPDKFAEIRKGDKIIVIKNSTKLGIYNGQTAKVIGMINKPEIRQTPIGQTYEGKPCNHLRIQIFGQSSIIDIPEDDVPKHVQLGYIITVHKSQGSDWPHVIVMQPSKVREDTARKFFYTAVTRAKNKLSILSCQRTVQWWTNAASDAAPEPTTLMRRLEREEVDSRAQASHAEQMNALTAEDLLR